MKKTFVVLLVVTLLLSGLNVATGEETSFWTKFWKEPIAPDPQLALSEYKKVDYKKTLRSFDSYMETPLRFKGEVWGFDSYSDDAVIAVFVDRDSTKVLLCFAKSFSNWKWGDNEDVERLLAGDRVTVYGYLYDGIETEMDEYPFVPLFRIASITLHE